MPPFLQGWGVLQGMPYSEELTKIQEEVLPPKMYVRATEAVKEIVERVLDGCEIVVCGSFAQGTAVSGSDLDVSILKNGGGVDREHGIKLLEKLQKHLQGTPIHLSNGLQVAEAVFTASVPILRLVYVHTVGVHPSLPIDVSVGSATSGKRDSIVKDILMRNPSVLLPLSIIKYWTKRRHVVKAYEGFPNSISWSLLYICHCQIIGLLPAHNNISTWTSPSMTLTETQVLTSFFGFLFQYSSDGTFANFKCDVLTGSLSPRPDQGIPDQCPLWVCDPVEEGNNVARSVKLHQWGVATGEAHRAFTLLAQFSGLFEILADKEAEDTTTEGASSVDEASSSASLPLSDEPPTGRALQWNGEAAALTKFEPLPAPPLVVPAPPTPITVPMPPIVLPLPQSPTVGDCVMAINLQKEVHVNNAKGVVLDDQIGTLKLVDFIEPPHGRLVIDTSNIKLINVEMLFPLSTRVQAHSLVTHKTVNGCQGIVVGHADGCVLVQFPQPHGGMSVRPRNLYPVRPLPSPSTPPEPEPAPQQPQLPHCELEYEVRPTMPPLYYSRSTNTASLTPPPGFHNWLGTSIYSSLSYMGHEAPKITGMLLDAAHTEPYKVWSLLSSPKQLRAQAMVAAAHLHHHACRLRTQQPTQPSGNYV